MKNRLTLNLWFFFRVFTGVLLLSFALSGAEAWADTYYFGINSVPAVTTDPGFGMMSSPAGSYGVSQITATPEYWYTDPAGSCNYNAGLYSIVLWTSQESGQTSNVTVELDVVDSDGSNPTMIGTQTINVNSPCPSTCNGATTFSFGSATPISFINQRFRIVVSLGAGSTLTPSFFLPSTGPGVFPSTFITPLNSCDAPTPTYTPQASCALSSPDFYLMPITDGSAYPVGQFMETTVGTGGVPWVQVPQSPTSMVFYSPAEIGTFSAGVANFTAVRSVNAALISEPVSVTIGYANLDGSGYTQIGATEIDFTSNGVGAPWDNNGAAVDYQIPYSAATLNNQMIVFTLQSESSEPVSMLYGGSAPSLDSNIQMGPMITSGCVCPTTELIERSSSSDLLLYIPNQTSFPPGWTTFSSATAITDGFSAATSWTSMLTGPYFNPADPWMSFPGAVAGEPGSDGGDQSDMNLILNNFNVPAGATNVQGILFLSVDDNADIWMNGTNINTDVVGSTTNQLVRSFPIPTTGSGSMTAGANVLAIEDNDVQEWFLGYEYELDIYYQMPCVSNTPTNTPTTTPTSTPAITSTFTNTPTTTPTNTVTNTATVTLTNTVTNTPTYTPTATSSNTPTTTPTVTVTNTVTNTATTTATNTVTNTVTNTSTITPTPSPTPGIALVKSVSETQAHAGDTLTYTIAVTISGNAITGMVITDTLPVGVTFSMFVTVGSTVVGTFDKNTDLMQWVMPSPLAPGIYDLIYQTQVNQVVVASVPIVNKAQLTYPGQGSSLISSAPVTVLGQYTVDVNIYDSSGEVVKTFPVEQFTQSIDSITLESSNTITTLTGPGSTIEVLFEGVVIGTWNGMNNANQPVSNGQYIIKIDNVSAQGLVTSVSQAAVVNRSLSNITANVYNSAGEIIKTLYQVVADPVGSNMTGVNLNSGVIKPGTQTSQGINSQVQIVIQTSGTPVTLMWDGTNNSDTVVTPGEYEIEVHWNNGSGETTDISRQIMVLAGSGAGGLAIARPNVLGGTNGLTTTFDGTGVPNAYTVNVKIYTVAGELVRNILGAAGTAQAQWNASGIASGIYIAAVEIDNANGGMINRQFLKVLIEH